jgi:predicted porin
VTYSTGHDSAVVAGPPTSNSGAAYNPGATNCPGNLPGDPLDCRQITALLGYWAPHYGGQIVYDEIRGGVGVLPGSASFEPSGAKPFPSSSDKTTRYMVSGYSKFEKVTISGGLIHRRTTMPGAPNYQTNIFYLGTSYFFRPDIVFDGEISRITTTDQKNANFYVMRATYLLSKRTAVYTMLGFMQNNSAAAYSAGVGYATIPGAKQVGILVGMRTTF